MTLNKIYAVMSSGRLEEAHACAGSSMLRVVVPDLDASRAALKARQLTLGPTSGRGFRPLRADR